MTTEKEYILYTFDRDGVKYIDIDSFLSENEHVMIISRGVSGSGKSTAISKIVPKQHIYATDDFWGEGYNFDRSMLKDAHLWNENRVDNSLSFKVKVIGVDNTNLSFFDLFPYFQMAKAYGYAVAFVESNTKEWLEFKKLKHDRDDPSYKENFEKLVDFFLGRNQHGVPRKIIKGQAFVYQDENYLAKLFKSYIPKNEKTYELAIRLMGNLTSGRDLAKLILEWDANDTLKDILPEVANLHGFLHNAIHHPEGDAFEHTICAVINSRSRDKITNLAVLLHDIGKALTYKNRGTEQDPKHTYYAHDKIGEEMIPIIIDRLFLTKENENQLRFAVLHHMQLHSYEYSKNPKSKELSEHQYWYVLKDVGYADEMARPEGVRQLEKFELRIKNFETPVIKSTGAKFTGAHLKELIPNIENRQIGEVMKMLSQTISKDEWNNVEFCSKKALDIYNCLLGGFK